jgi:hypothetical protein
MSPADRNSVCLYCVFILFLETLRDLSAPTSNLGVVYYEEIKRQIHRILMSVGVMKD